MKLLGLHPKLFITIFFTPNFLGHPPSYLNPLNIFLYPKLSEESSKLFFTLSRYSELFEDSPQVVYNYFFTTNLQVAFVPFLYLETFGTPPKVIFTSFRYGLRHNLFIFFFTLNFYNCFFTVNRLELFLLLIFTSNV